MTGIIFDLASLFLFVFRTCVPSRGIVIRRDYLIRETHESAASASRLLFCRLVDYLAAMTRSSVIREKLIKVIFSLERHRREWVNAIYKFHPARVCRCRVSIRDRYSGHGVLATFAA